jgi:hypothetical protein
MVTPPRAAHLAIAASMLGLAVPSSAAAAQRWAAPAGAATGGSCSEVVPCTIEVAVNQAASGDEVVVEPGTYSVTAPLDAPGPIDLHGVAGRPRPRLDGSPALLSAVLTAKQGGTTRHLRIDGVTSALVVQDGIAEDLLLSSSAADGAKVVESVRGTVLRDSVVLTAAGGSDDSALKLSQSSETGSAALVNVTALAREGEATGISCALRGGQARIVNTIVRGAAADVDATASPSLCSARNSNLRPALSPGLAAGAGDQDAEPSWVDAAGGDFRPAPGSPTIDAGTDDPLLGAADPMGCPRRTDAGPDIGAYEYADASQPCSSAVPEPVGTPAAAPGPAPAPAPATPKLGRAVVVSAGRGKVRVKPPGARRFRAVSAAVSVPVGSVIDATGGRVELASALDRAGVSQNGSFWGARFRVLQSRTGTGMTTLELRGGDFRACRRGARAASRPIAVASRRRHHRVVRSLWGRDSHGRFRTHGANSVATARGTAWLTRDRCDGTVTRVREGAVAVRDLNRHRTTLVRAGHAYLARARD